MRRTNKFVIWFLAMGSMISLLIFASGCSMAQGDVPILTVAGQDIVLGMNKPNDLEDFKFSDPHHMLLPGQLDPYTYAYSSIPAYCDDIQYADLYIYNPTNKAAYYVNCYLYKISFYMKTEKHSQWAEDNILVSGIDFCGMNADEVKEAMQKYKLVSEQDDGTLQYKDGDYTYVINFQEDNGLVEKVTVEMDKD